MDAFRRSLHDAEQHLPTAQKIVVDAQAVLTASQNTVNEMDNDESISDAAKTQARINLRAAQYRLADAKSVVQQAQLAIQSARTAYEDAILAPGPAHYRGDDDLPGIPPARRRLVVRRAFEDLSAEDIAALCPLIKSCYVALGETELEGDDVPEDFGTRFCKDVFSSGWTSEMQPPKQPIKPLETRTESCAVMMGTLMQGCIGAEANPGVPVHRGAGALVYCKVKLDSTRLMFDYVDCRGQLIDYEQVDKGTGTTAPNVIWTDSIERVHARAIAVWDRAQRLRFSSFNRTCYVNEARASLHHWYHVGKPYEKVPNLGFKAVHPYQLGAYVSRIHAEVSAVSKEMEMDILLKGNH